MATASPPAKAAPHAPRCVVFLMGEKGVRERAPAPPPPTACKPPARPPASPRSPLCPRAGRVEWHGMRHAHQLLASPGPAPQSDKKTRHTPPFARALNPRALSPPFHHRATLTLADFNLARRLGSGAFAEVYLATPRVPIPGVAWPPLPPPSDDNGGGDGTAPSTFAPAAPAVALKVVDKHLLTRTPGAVDAVRRERDIMDVLGGLASAAAAAEGGGGGGTAGGEGSGRGGAAPASPAATAALARLPPGLHPLWAATRTVRLLFTFQDAASLYFGLEACPGGDLFAQVAARGRLRPADARPYLADAVAALAALGAVGVAHRDVKPENLMLDAGGRLKLGDFGCAAWVRGRGGGGGEEGPPPPPAGVGTPSPAAHHPLARGARAPTFVGTADYVPPEALGGLNNSSSDGDGGSEEAAAGDAGEAAVPARPRHPPHPPPPPFAADAWALGCVAYQLLVGVPPFRAATEYLTYQRIAAHDLRWPGRRPGRGGGGGGGGDGSEEAGCEGGGSGADAGADASDAGDTLPADAVDLITRLLDPNPATRLGAGGDSDSGGGGGGGGGGGMEAVMRHPFFLGVAWDTPGGGLAAPPPVPPPPSRSDATASGGDAIDAEEDEVDWELASLAAALPVTYSYEAGQVTPAGATGVVPPPPPRPASPAVAGQDWGEG